MGTRTKDNMPLDSLQYPQAQRSHASRMSESLGQGKRLESKKESNESLPFDILYEIFKYYVKTETPAHPVETLLLVCKFWSCAAVCCSDLWTSFTIEWKDLDFWGTHLPLRLGRSSPSSLLDISITIRATFGLLQQRLDEKLSNVIELLIGSHGEIAARWRRVTANDDSTYDGLVVVPSPAGFDWHTRLIKLFSFPTPRLEELSLSHVVASASTPMLPSTPLLRILTAREGKFLSLPSLHSISELSLSTSYLGDGCRLTDAVDLTKLEITRDSQCYSSSLYSLTGTYPRLRSLSLCSGLHSDGLRGFAAPNLTHLTLDLGNSSDSVAIASCDGMPLTGLEELVLGHSRIARASDLSWCFAAIRKLLRATRVKVLVFSGLVLGALIFNLLTGDCESLYQDDTLVLKFDEYEITVGHRDARLSSMETLRQLYDVDIRQFRYPSSNGRFYYVDSEEQ